MSKAFGAKRLLSSGAKNQKIALIGGRGHTGTELVKIIANHSVLDLSAVRLALPFIFSVKQKTLLFLCTLIFGNNRDFFSSREFEGQEVASRLEGAPSGLKFTNIKPADVEALGADVIVLALPNGLAAPYAAV